MLTKPMRRKVASSNSRTLDKKRLKPAGFKNGSAPSKTKYSANAVSKSRQSMAADARA